MSKIILIFENLDLQTILESEVTTDSLIVAGNDMLKDAITQLGLLL